MNSDYLKRLFCLDGKKAIVTGGNSGIGAGIAVSLASCGADVTILGRDQKTINDVTKSLADLGSKGKGYQVDVSKKSDVKRFFETYYSENDNKLDILVSNAGISVFNRALETAEEDIDKLYDINFKGALFCSQYAAEAMKKQKSGNIVIVTSVNAMYPLPPQAVYTSTKNALEGIMQCMAVDLAPFGIRVNSIAPGGTLTHLDRSSPVKLLRPEDKIHPEIPLGRIGEPEDIGDAVICMVSDAFRYMTGSTVLVDGGLRLRNV